MDMEERVGRIETQLSKHDERLDRQDERMDRHSKRIHTLEDGAMRDAVEIASTKKDVESLCKQSKSMNSRMVRIEETLSSQSKWMKAIVIICIITLGVVWFKDPSSAKDIAKTATPLVGGVIS